MSQLGRLTPQLLLPNSCVNDQIVHAVQARNASCFDALANKTDRTTDGWITCMFEGLLGDRQKSAPAIAGGMRASSNGRPQPSRRAGV